MVIVAAVQQKAHCVSVLAERMAKQLKTIAAQTVIHKCVTIFLIQSDWQVIFLKLHTKTLHNKAKSKLKPPKPSKPQKPHPPNTISAFCFSTWCFCFFLSHYTVMLVALRGRALGANAV